MFINSLITSVLSNFQFILSMLVVVIVAACFLGRYVVLTKNQQPSEELVKEIQNYVKTHTAPYKYPRQVEFIEAMPKTTSGKIRRSELRKMSK